MKNRKQVKHTQGCHNNIFGAPSNKSVCPHQIKLYIKTKTEKKNYNNCKSNYQWVCVCGAGGGLRHDTKKGFVKIHNICFNIKNNATLPS